MGSEDFWFLARLWRRRRFENPATELKQSGRKKLEDALTLAGFRRKLIRQRRALGLTGRSTQGVGQVVYDSNN